MDVRDQLIGVRRDNCKRAYPLARSWVFPVFPKAAETKRPTILHGDCVGLFGFLPLDCHPSKNPSTGMMQRLDRYASRNVGRVCTVSQFALIGFRPPCGSSQRVE